MPFQIFFKLDRGEILLSRMERARAKAICADYWREAAFGRRRRLQCEPALDWLDNVIEEGCEELSDQFASSREVEYVLPD